MIKKYLQRFGGMRQDPAADKDTGDKYWSARNIRITATDSPSQYAVTNEHGNVSVLLIPEPTINLATTSIDYVFNDITKSLSYETTNSEASDRCQIEEEYNGKLSEDQQIIGVIEARDSVIIATTDDNGFDCFWEFTNLNSGEFDLTLLYMNNLTLNSDYPLQIIYNYENSIIEKIYFVDGVQQLRFMNIRQSKVNGDILNLADVDPSSVDTVSNFSLSQISIIDVVGGGGHTSGMVQYSYGLYILNGAQTTISPLTDIKPIDRGNGLGGGAVNINLGKSVRISIPNLDRNYTHIKVYRIKYTSLNEAPTISIAVDKEIDDYNSMEVYDTGSSEGTISLEQFIFLGSAPKIPKHLASKDSRMFLINIKDKTFDLDLDMRAYGHNSFAQGAKAVIQEKVTSIAGFVSGTERDINTTTYSVDKKHDSINKDYDVYKFQKDGVTLGGEGKYIKFELVQSAVVDSINKRFFKDRELYRIGILFYNSRGQTSNPLWVSDFVAPEGNLEGLFNQLKVTLKSEFTTWLNNPANFEDEYGKPVGYKIIRADRQLNDRTIITQGLINPMVANYHIARKKEVTLLQRTANASSAGATKMPSMIRTFQTEPPFVKCKNYHELSWNHENDSSKSDLSTGQDYECHKSGASEDFMAQTLQFNQLIQLFSPEISFADISVDSSLKLRIRGLQKTSQKSGWFAEITVPDGITPGQEATFEGGFTTDTSSATSLVGSAGNLNDKGLFGASNNKSRTGFNQFFREFNGGFLKNIGSIQEYQLFGTPEISERGAGPTQYNGSDKFRYVNHLKALLQDDFNHTKTGPSSVKDDSKIQVTGCNSYGERNVTFVEGSNLMNARSIEEIKAETGISNNDGVLIAELKRPDDQRYVGAIYGGFSYEAKSSASYIQIGSYKDISDLVVDIDSPGDTYVQNFIFTKFTKTEVALTARNETQVTEIVSIPVETTIDLKNREDFSLHEWDNKFQPRYDEYSTYNRVYSQQANLIRSTDTGFKFKKVSEFDTRIIASKEKIAGEGVDSWTDFLENEQQDLDGKYGPINAVVNWKDEIFTLQDTGVARIAINPRVQTTGADGLSIELGTGKVLHDYHYITTTSGSLGKWCIKSTDKGFYYFDLLKKSIMASYGGSVVNLTDQHGLHSFMENNIDYDDFIDDLPNKNKGVVIGVHNATNDVFISFKKTTNSFTLGFNEKITSQNSGFVTIYDYVPSYYISKGSTLLMVGPDGKSLWQHFKGNRCQFFGVTYDSEMIMTPRSPLSSGDINGGKVIFNNMEWKSLVKNAEGVELNKTISKIRAYNDYQDTGLKDLIIRENLRRRNRSWTASIPRVSGSRDRITSPWCFVEIKFINGSNETFLLHETNILYSQY